MPDLEQLLRSDIAGAASRAAGPAAFETVASRGRRRRRRARTLVVSTCALLIAVGGVGTMLGGAPKPDVAHRPGTVQAVPWAPLDPTYPQIPEHRTPPRPDPALAADAPACRASDLRAGGRKEGVGGGTVVRYVVFRLAGDRPCRLDGEPDVVMLDHGQRVDVPVQGSRRGDLTFHYPWPVLVEAGSPAVLDMTWASLWCTDPVKTDQIRITLPEQGGSFTVSGFGESPYCSGEPGSGPTPVVVSPFAPQRFRAGRTVSPYAGVKARLGLPADAEQGRSMSFTVTLTARHDVDLVPCPDFSIDQYAAGGSAREDRYALNCRAVRYRDAAGRPYLPARTPVTFRMRTTPLGVGASVKFVWQLEVPEGVAVGAVL